MRRKVKRKTRLAPDRRYQSVKVTKLINYLMHRGQKETASRIVYGALAAVERETKEKALEVFERALLNASPALEVRSRRVGGANYQVPYEVSPERRLALSLRWLVAFSRAGRGKPMAAKLAGEIIAASKKEGETIKRKETMEKMAEANRAFAHFALSRRNG